MPGGSCVFSCLVEGGIFAAPYQRAVFLMDRGECCLPIRAVIFVMRCGDVGQFMPEHFNGMADGTINVDLD